MRLLAWIGAWTAVIASAAVLPLWASIVLAVGILAAQLLLPHGAAGCHLPEGVRNGTRPDR
jgi:hypothetical protein